MMSPKLEKKLLRIAYDLRGSVDAGNKHFTFLIRGNKVVSLGWNNSCKSHPMGKKLGYFSSRIHSELSAYIRLQDKSQIPNLSIVNIRMSKTGVINIARPCKYCMPWIQSLGFRKLYYTQADGQFVRGW